MLLKTICMMIVYFNMFMVFTMMGLPLVNPILEVAKKTLDIKWATRIKVNKLLPQKTSEEQVQHLWASRQS